MPINKTSFRKLVDRILDSDLQKESTDLVQLLENEIDLDWREAVELAEELGREFSLHSLPIYAYQFLARFAEENGASQILDPCVEGGMLLSSLVDQIGEDVKGHGIVQDSKLGVLARAIGKDLPVTWEESPPLEGVRDLSGSFDFIASMPPFGAKERAGETFDFRGQEVELRGAESHLAVLKASRLLREGGRAVFLVPDSFFWKKLSPWEEMGEAGIFPQAVISLPAGSLSNTGIPVNFLMVGGEPSDRLFVAKLSASGQIDPILSNLSSRKEGSKKELGVFVEHDQFESWRSIELDEQIERLARRSGMEELQLGQVAEAIFTSQPADGNETFESKQNALYLPRHGRPSLVTTEPEEATPPRNFLQITLDPEQASAEFVARFLHSEFGEVLFERWAKGSTPMHISTTGLEDRRIFLPGIDTQEDVLESHQTMEELRLQLNQLESRLWKRPVSVDDINQKVSRLNKDEGIESWIETLPFPLASVLRKYHAVESLRDKCGFLLDFFEATAEFFTVVMLSALQNDENRFRNRKGKWLGVDEGYGESLKKSSFGNWSEIGSRVAKETRRMISGDERDQCLELYRARSADWVQAVSNKELYKVLDTVVDYRNSWKGHSATTTKEKIFQERLRKLEGKLNEVRNVISYAFEDVGLLKPEQMRYTEGVYHAQVKELKGAQTIFEERTTETTVPMDTKRLYLMEKGQNRALELLPFFRLMASPRSEENAFYFYNRVEDEQSGKVRWLTYHFEGSRDEDKAPTIESPDAVDALQKLIEDE
ncbi:hypothetical protein GGQ20_002332 [Salinibacter ruber]|uniref:hypothetical protein n=1 Tax=Salinibacter ruber TaxID=146919 RepID=UPI002168D74F|nr:hypothetical protein [Salinibacter ruber]MCS3701010.1 hypothetical protein [Salinibacter ruber]